MCVSAIPNIYSSIIFFQCFTESHNLTTCINELIQIHHTDVSYLLKLRASQALFSALDTCRDGIIVTGLDHNIQVVFMIQYLLF